MSYGNDDDSTQSLYSQNQGPGLYPNSQSGNYKMGPNGTYQPFGSKAVPPTQPNIGQHLNNMVQSLMRGYVRKQEQPGSYLPLTSAAPDSALQSFAPLDKYRSFGVPFTGIQYGQNQNSGDPYSAMFSSPGGGSTGY